MKSFLNREEFILLARFLLKDTNEELGVVDVVVDSIRIGGTFQGHGRNFRVETFDLKTDSTGMLYYEVIAIQVPLDYDIMGGMLN